MRQGCPADDARQSFSHFQTARGLVLGAQLGSRGLTQPVAARRLHASSCIEIDPCGTCGKGCHNLDGACLHAGGKCTLKGTSVWTGARYPPRALASPGPALMRLSVVGHGPRLVLLGSTSP